LCDYFKFPKYSQPFFVKIAPLPARRAPKPTAEKTAAQERIFRNSYAA